MPNGCAVIGRARQCSAVTGDAAGNGIGNTAGSDFDGDHFHALQHAGLIELVKRTTSASIMKKVCAARQVVTDRLASRPCRDSPTKHFGANDTATRHEAS
eukprot:4231057-Amphidinium_carterae.1